MVLVIIGFWIKLCLKWRRKDSPVHCAVHTLAPRCCTSTSLVPLPTTACPIAQRFGHRLLICDDLLTCHQRCCYRLFAVSYKIVSNRYQRAHEAHSGRADCLAPMMRMALRLTIVRRRRPEPFGQRCQRNRVRLGPIHFAIKSMRMESEYQRIALRELREGTITNMILIHDVDDFF